MTVDKELRRTVYHVGMQSLEAMPPSPPASPAKVAFPGAIALPSQLAPHQRAEQFVVWYLGAYGITPFYRPPPPPSAYLYTVAYACSLKEDCRLLSRCAGGMSRQST